MNRSRLRGNALSLISGSAAPLKNYYFIVCVLSSQP